MRNLIFIFIPLIFACSSTKDVPQLESTKTKNNIIQGEFTVNHTSSLSMDTAIHQFSYSFYSNENGELQVYQDSINKRIYDFVRLSTEFEIDENRNPVLSEKFFHEQLAIFDSIAQIDYSESESTNLWDLQESITITEFDSFVELNLSNWSYTGGAHGNGVSGYFLIDKKTGSVLYLKDVISDVSYFTTIAEKHFREENGLSPTENLTDAGFWFVDGVFSCNENFYFSENKLFFFYNSYEIAPYSAGQISFSIPLSEIDKLLKINP